MPLDTPETAPITSPEDQERLRAEVRALMQAETLTMKQIATICGIPYGTFSSWMGGTYQGRSDRIAADTQRGLEAHRAKKRSRALAPKSPGFVVTRTAEAIYGVLEHAQHTPEMVVVTGGPGVGKTRTAREYQARNPNVFLLTMEPVHSNPRSVLDDLCTAIGIEARGLSTSRLSRAITAKLRGTGALILVDEAQHLTSQTLDQLRSLHDLAEVGIALLGNETTLARLEGGTRAAHYAQLYSRVGMRLSRAKPLAADIASLLDAWGVEDEAQRRLLIAIARKPGALRGMTKVLQNAHRLAAAAATDGEAPALSERLIRLAWERYSSQSAIEDDGAAKGAAA